MMEREPIIFGKNLTSEEKKEWQDLLQKAREKSLEPIEGELEKTPEELQFIGKINLWTNEELKEMGISEDFLVKPEQIHFLSHDDYSAKFFKDVNSGAICDPTTQIIFIDKSARRRTELYRTIFHEILHLASYYKGKVYREEKKLREYRSGYGIISGLEKYHQHLSAFNEAMIDKVRGEIFRKHLDEFFEEFQLTQQERKETFPYNPYEDVVDIIIDKIAAKNGESRDKVWKRFKKGLFTGEMMHLREVERVFGKDALKIIGMGAIAPDKPFDWDTFKKIKKYFKVDDETERQKMNEEILKTTNR